MKKILISTVTSVVALMALGASAAYPPGTGALSINWQVSTGPAYVPSTKTNTMIIKKGTADIGTNTVVTVKGSTKTTSFDGASFLALLAVSLNDAALTNKGNALAIDQNNSVYVVNGTKVITNVPSSILTVTILGQIASGTGTYTTLTEKSGANAAVTTYQGTESDTFTIYVKLSYDDSSVITDGTASTFTFTGISKNVIDFTIVNKTDDLGTATSNFNLSDGAGGGTISGKFSIITGSATGGPVKTTE